MSSDWGPSCTANMPAPTSHGVSHLPGSPRVMLLYQDTAIHRAWAHGTCSTANPLLTLIGGRSWDQHKPPTAHPSPAVPAGAAGYGPWLLPPEQPASWRRCWWPAALPTAPGTKNNTQAFKGEEERKGKSNEGSCGVLPVL